LCQREQKIAVDFAYRFADSGDQKNIGHMMPFC